MQANVIFSIAIKRKWKMLRLFTALSLFALAVQLQASPDLTIAQPYARIFDAQQSAELSARDTQSGNFDVRGKVLRSMDGKRVGIVSKVVTDGMDVMLVIKFPGLLREVLYEVDKVYWSREALFINEVRDTLLSLRDIDASYYREIYPGYYSARDFKPDPDTDSLIVLR